MQHSFVSPVTGIKETPIRLLIKHFPELAKKVSGLIKILTRKNLMLIIDI